LQISVVAFRTARVLEELLDTVPGAIQHLQEEFLEELKYSILQKRVSEAWTASCHFPSYGFEITRNSSCY
jgi:hypothetical protein